MAITVQARLDDKTEAALKRIERRTGWSRSRILRECILHLESREDFSEPFKIIGQGEIVTGYTDLATNKKYLESFGSKSGFARRMKRAS